MYYRLKAPWSLRGYGKQLLMLDRYAGPGGWYQLTAPLYRLLEKCDGVTPFDTDATDAYTAQALQWYLNDGVLEASDTPRPILPVQAYRYYSNRRITGAMWGITGRCNLRCRHCFMASDTAASPHTFTMEEVRRTIDQLVDCGVQNVTLTGGEPLLHPHFEEIVRAIGKAGLQVVRLYTNGVLLRQETLDLFRERGMQPEMIVSFDGLGTHDWMRNVPGAEAAASRAIALAVRNGFPVGCAMNLNSVTMDRAVDTARYLRGLGVENMFYIRTSEAPKWLENHTECLSVDAYCEAIVEITRALIREVRGGMLLRFFNTITISPNETRETLMKPRQVYHSQDIPFSAWCYKCVNTMFVASDGRVLPCDAFEGGTRDGGFLCADNNLFQRDLDDILDTSSYAKFLEISMDDMGKANPACRECTWWAHCHGGGCRACGIAAGATETGAYSAQDFTHISAITCAFYRGGYFERILDLLEATP